MVLRGEGRAIGGLSWSPDGKAIVFADNNRTIRHEQTPAYSGSKIIYTISENVPGETDVVNVDGTGMKTLGSGGGFGGRRWLDARHFLVDRTSPDFKRRTTSVVDIAGGEPKVLHEEVADKFWSITGDAGRAAVAGRQVDRVPQRPRRLGSLRNVMPAARRRRPVQITKGRFEVRAPQWSPDSTRIAFDANEPDHYGDRHLYVATIGTDPAQRDDRGGHQRPRHRHRRRSGRPTARGSSISTPIRTTPRTSGSPTRNRPRNRRGCPTRCRRRWIARRSSSRSR